MIIIISYLCSVNTSIHVYSPCLYTTLGNMIYNQQVWAVTGQSLTGQVKIQEESIIMTEVNKDHGIEHSSEDEIRHIEASGLCLVNRHFTLPWLHTPQAPPPMEHKVHIIPSDSSHIYSEIGTVIGRREQSESLPLTDNVWEHFLRFTQWE